jgi:hypothetical protein
MAEWTGVVNATAIDYFKGADDHTIRRRLLLSMLRRRGRIKYNASGYKQVWDVEFSEPEVRAYGDAGSQVFNSHDAYRQLENDWRGYTVTDKLTKKQQLMNKGPSAIIDLYETKLPKMKKSLSNRFGNELYIDGNAAGNENRIHGLASFLGDDGATAVTDLIANPSDTYGGLSTALANQGGAWTTTANTTAPNATIGNDWPNGSGDSEYDFLAPKLMNYSSTRWNNGGTSWAENCEKVMRQACIWSNVLGHDSANFCHLLSSQMFADFKNFMSARNRISVPHKEAEDLGFHDTLNFDGSVVKYEYGVPHQTGFLLCLEEMQVESLQEQLFVPDGPDWNMLAKAFLFEVGFFGNCRYNPKAFGKYAAYA